MTGKKAHPTRINERLIWIGIGLAVVFWFIESAIHVFVFHDGRLIQQMVSPERHEIWMRFIVVAILILFGAYAQRIVTQRRKAEQATKRALAELNQIFETAFFGPNGALIMVWRNY
jgi:hypothetical protein